jgi:D-alanine-D-alanine ligase
MSLAADNHAASGSSALPEIVVLCGAVSPEREVSLRSGAACHEALLARYPRRVSLVRLDANTLPPGLDPARHVIFPVIHGDYGEDGGIQADLEARGFAYAGCDAASSRICINKAAAKEKFRAVGAPVAPGVAFRAAEKPEAGALLRTLGTADIVLKPLDKGSSVGLRFIRSEADAVAALGELTAGNWLAEARVVGREMTIGILDGVAQGIVEIRPRQGRYDYATKYTAGASEYLYPAEVPARVEEEVSRAAERLFAACGCRDFSRADFILREDGTFVFLEINTMPGMTATSLLPKSVHCKGLTFEELCERMIRPALGRWKSAISGT